MGDGDEGLDEKLDRERHGSGEHDPEEQYGRRGVVPDRSKREPADEDSRDAEDSDEEDSDDDDRDEDDSDDHSEGD